MRKPKIRKDYSPDIGEDIKTGKLLVIARPKVIVNISKKKGSLGSMHFLALVDSGADRNLFPAEHARRIDIDVESGKQRLIGGIANKPIKAYTHKVFLHFEEHFFNVEVDFSDECEVSLLGRVGFFDQFRKISFNQKKEEMLFSI